MLKIVLKLSFKQITSFDIVLLCIVNRRRTMSLLQKPRPSKCNGY